MSISRNEECLKCFKEFDGSEGVVVGGSRIERYMTSKYRLSAGQLGSVAKLLLSEFPKPAEDLWLLSAIPNALQLRSPHRPQHAIQFVRGLWLPFDVAVIAVVIGKQARGLGKRDVAGRAAAVDYIEWANGIEVVRSNGVAHRSSLMADRAFSVCVLCLTPPAPQTPPPYHSAPPSPRSRTPGGPTPRRGGRPRSSERRSPRGPVPRTPRATARRGPVPPVR